MTEFDIEWDDKWFCLFLSKNPQRLDLYRINCMDRLVMLIRARIWYSLEFPNATPTEKRYFSEAMTKFLEENKEAILREAKRLDMRKHEELKRLGRELIQEIENCKQ